MLAELWPEIYKFTDVEDLKNMKLIDTNLYKIYWSNLKLFLEFKLPYIGFTLEELIYASYVEKNKIKKLRTPLLIDTLIKLNEVDLDQVVEIDWFGALLKDGSIIYKGIRYNGKYVAILEYQDTHCFAITVDGRLINLTNNFYAAVKDVINISINRKTIVINTKSGYSILHL